MVDSEDPYGYDPVALENEMHRTAFLRLEDVKYALEKGDTEGAIKNLHDAQNEILDKHPEIDRVRVTVPFPQADSGGGE